MNVTIIGTGNLGASLALGLNQASFVDQLTLTRKSNRPNQTLADAGLEVITDNLKAVQEADVVILCVKPFKVEEVVVEIAPVLKPSTILVSVATGIPIETIKASLGEHASNPVFRAMPNTAASVNESVTCIAHLNQEKNTCDKVEQIFNTIGTSILIDESLMDAATVLGACGIAYVMRFVRAMVQGGIEIGFDSKTANQITNQTIKGAIELLIQNGKHPEEEIDKVTTPKGCTIAGLNEMEYHGFSSSMIKGIKTSFEKI